MRIEIDQPARDFLIDKGFNPDFGARPLRRAIEQYVEDPLSDAILRDQIKENQVIKITRKEGEDHLDYHGEPLPAASASPSDGDSPGEPVAHTAEST